MYGELFPNLCNNLKSEGNNIKYEINFISSQICAIYSHNLTITILYLFILTVLRNIYKKFSLF